MTIRTDVTVDWNRSPRIILVEDPSDEISAQDLLDTCKYHEDLPPNIDDEHLVNASGKENLGGGVSVGITLELQNSIVAFEQRTTSDESGTATTADSTGTSLIDTAATFQTNLITPGATIINFTDQSVTTVIEVISETEIDCYPLEDGTDNQWEIGDFYKIFNVDQCEISGGNVVAVDDLGAESDAAMPTAFTHLIRTSSSSATLQESAAIQYSSYGGGVTVDIGSSYSGTSFPVGTPQQPVNNMIDALSIAQAKGLSAFFILGDITLDDSLNFEQYSFYGESIDKTTFTIEANADVEKCEFYEGTVQGILDGQTKLKNCLINDINYISGYIELCVLGGTVTLGGASDAYFLDCWAGTKKDNPPVVDMGGSGQTLVLQNFNGAIKIINKTGVNDECNISLNAGMVVLDSTVTAGSVNIMGTGALFDYSNGAIVDTSYLVNPLTVADSVWAHDVGIFLKDIEGGRWKIDTSLNQMIFYKADNSTVIAKFNLYDSSGQAASEDVYERSRVATTTTTTTSTTTTTT